MAIGTLRRRWRWLRVGQTQIQPYPNGGLTIEDKAMLNGHLVLIGTCVPTPFTEMLKDDIDEVFLNTDEFAIDGLYNTVDDESFTIQGIFDDPYALANPSVTVGMQSIGPTFKCELADINDNSLGLGPRKGDTLEVCGTVYQVVIHKPDGVGLVVLYLQKY